MEIKDIPKPFLVGGVILVGVMAILYFQKPHSPCDIQFNTFQENQQGNIYSKAVKNKLVHAPYRKARDQCLAGNSSGACYEYFQILDKLARDLSYFDQQCGEKVEELPDVKIIMTQGVSWIVKLAWGENPPTKENKYNWLMTSDVAIFCKLKKNWIRFWGRESFMELQKSIHEQLPGEPMVSNDKGLCINCQTRAKATAIFPISELREKSLFFLSCEGI